MKQQKIKRVYIFKIPKYMAIFKEKHIVNEVQQLCVWPRGDLFLSSASS